MILAPLVAALALASSTPLVADTPAPVAAAQAPAEDRGVVGYLKDALVFDAPWSPSYDLSFLFYSYICLQFCEFGSLLWMPRLYFGEVPDNAARRTALKLGMLATALAFVPTWVPILLPGVVFFGLGVPLAFLFNLFVHGVLFPRAIAIALKDAQQMGEEKPSTP